MFKACPPEGGGCGASLDASGCRGESDAVGGLSVSCEVVASRVGFGRCDRADEEGDVRGAWCVGFGRCDGADPVDEDSPLACSDAAAGVGVVADVVDSGAGGAVVFPRTALCRKAVLS